jgi:hypothetical protein
MPEFMKQFFAEIRKIIVDELIAWFRRISLIAKIAVICIIAAIIGGIYYKDEVVRYAGIALYVPRAIFGDLSHAGPLKATSLPLSSHTEESTKEIERRLVQREFDDLAHMSNGKFTPWSVSQAVISVATDIADKEKIVAFINSGHAQGCACWGEIANSSRDFHVPFISGWIFYAFAELKIPVTEEALDTLLAEQNEEGWWSTFPANNDRQYASTYTTAWALLGLLRQKREGYIKGEKVAAVERALTLGGEWLSSVRSAAARWKNYPYLIHGAKESESISGLVLHTLNQLLGDNVHHFNMKWLERLPEGIIGAGESEQYYIEISTPSGMAFDHFEQLKMPWTIVATVDAYSSGNIWQRAKALKWLEDILNDESVSESDGQNNWWRAEVLYSLHYTVK